MKPDLLVTMTMPDGHSELLAEDFTVHYFPRVADDDPALDDIVGKIRFVLTNGSIGINAALNFARERQWLGVIDQIKGFWSADPAA